MSTKTVPTLTLSGFVTHVPTMMIKIYEYFTTSDYSQSVCYFDKISSLSYLLNSYSSKPEELQTNMINTLNNLYRNYWSIYHVDVVINSFENDIYSLTIDIEVTVDKTTHSLNKLLKINTKTFLNDYKNLEHIKG